MIISKNANTHIQTQILTAQTYTSTITHTTSKQIHSLSQRHILTHKKLQLQKGTQKLTLKHTNKTYRYAYIHTYILIYSNTHIKTQSEAHTWTNDQTFAHANIHTCTHIHTQM